MNSPSSSATTDQPKRRWRVSESDLYCSAMKMRRSPELRQLLSVKSMMRYGPPTETAGLARSLVSGDRRSPTPPANTMTTTSSSMLALEDDARGGAVAVGELQRQAIHLVRPWLCVGEVQALDDDHAVPQEHVMRRCAGLLELLDREVIDPDHLDALVDEELGAVL